MAHILSRVDPYLIRLLGEVKAPTPGSSEFRFCCPKCEENGHTPDTEFKLYVNLDKGKFHCIRCQNFYGSLKYIYGSDYKPTVDWKRWKDIRSRILDEAVVDEADGAPLRTAGEYLSWYTTERWDVYSDNFYYLRRRLHGIPESEWNSTSGVWAKTFRQGKGKYWSRIFIIDWYKGEARYWNARTIYDDEGPKYLNPLLPRYSLLFNQENVERKQPPIVNVGEGALSMIHAGPNSIGTYGRVVTDAQLHILNRLKCKRFYVVAESDPDGWADAWNTARLLKGLRKEVFVTPMAKDQDPASMGRDAFTDHRNSNSIEYNLRNRVYSALGQSTLGGSFEKPNSSDHDRS